MNDKIDTKDAELLAFKYEHGMIAQKPQETKPQEAKAPEAHETKSEEHHHDHDHEEGHEHHHDHEHEHDHDHDEECGCGHHHHHHHHEEEEGHEHHHDHDHEEGHEHHHHHEHGEECCCGHDHDHEHEHHHHHHHDEPVEISTHEDSIIATVRLGSLGRDQQAAKVTLRSFMRAVAEETEGMGGMVGHIKFFVKESKGTMFSMTDLEEIQEKPAEGYEYTAEGVCIVLGIEPEQLEEIVERHLPERS